MIGQYHDGDGEKRRRGITFGRYDQADGAPGQPCEGTDFHQYVLVEDATA